MKTIILLPFLLIASGIYSVAGSDSQELSIWVTGMDDPYDTDRVTHLQVEVYNPGPDPVTPTFAVPGNALMNWYSWKIESGPAVINSGETVSYELSQLPYTGIPRNSEFRVIVNDVENPRFRGHSDLTDIVIERPVPAVINPGFMHWEPSMFATYDLPYGWVYWHLLHGEDDFLIEGEDKEVHLVLEPDMDRKDGNWSMVAVRQRIDYPATLTVDYINGTRGEHSGIPTTFTGVFIEDLYQRNQVMVLFTQDAPGREGEEIVTQELVALDNLQFQSVRVLVTGDSITIDVDKIFRDAGWEIPTKAYVDRQVHRPGDVGVGASTIGHGYEKFELITPLELKVFVASIPPHDLEKIEARFSFVQGNAVEPAPSRL